jgi:hypothetical protein
MKMHSVWLNKLFNGKHNKRPAQYPKQQGGKYNVGEYQGLPVPVCDVYNSEASCQAQDKLAGEKREYPDAKRIILFRLLEISPYDC